MENATFRTLWCRLLLLVGTVMGLEFVTAHTVFGNSIRLGGFYGTLNRIGPTC